MDVRFSRRGVGSLVYLRFNILQTLTCLSDEASVKNSLLVEVQVHLLMGTGAAWKSVSIFGRLT